MPQDACIPGAIPQSPKTKRGDMATQGLLGAIDLVGVPESVARARAFVREVLGRAHPVLDEVVLLVSELVTNSVTHSDSRRGGQVTLAVSEVDDTAHVEVLDSGSDSEPRVHDEPYGEGGRGLFLVDALSERWGIYRDGAGRVVWFALRFRGPGSINAVPGIGPEVRAGS